MVTARQPSDMFRTNRVADSETQPDVSVIVPALNEAENLPVLLPRIAHALSGRSYEVIVVDDDSQDRTRQVCAELAAKYPLKLIVRKNAADGLSGAVLKGMESALGETFIVMDADLQHPPESIPALIAGLEAGAEFVIGSRYVPGATTAERWGMLRKLNSFFATLLARPFAGNTNDPMSGLFALRRATYLSAERLMPLGYKIALELMCKTRARDVREIPIHFSARQRGQSKMTLKQQFRYLEHLSRLYDYTFPRFSPMLKFLIATLSGWFAALAGFLLLRDLHSGQASSVVLSYPLAILIVAVFHLRYIRTQRTFLPTHHPWIDFWVIAFAEWAAASLAATWIDYRIERVADWEMFLFSFFSGTIMRYILRKELLQDVRGVRKSARQDELH